MQGHAFKLQIRYTIGLVLLCNVSTPWRPAGLPLHWHPCWYSFPKETTYLSGSVDTKEYLKLSNLYVSFRYLFLKIKLHVKRKKVPRRFANRTKNPGKMEQRSFLSTLQETMKMFQALSLKCGMTFPGSAANSLELWFPKTCLFILLHKLRRRSSDLKENKCGHRVGTCVQFMLPSTPAVCFRFSFTGMAEVIFFHPGVSPVTMHLWSIPRCWQPPISEAQDMLTLKQSWQSGHKRQGLSDGPQCWVNSSMISSYLGAWPEHTWDLLTSMCGCRCYTKCKIPFVS